MIDVQRGGHRRIDRVLAPAFVADLGTLSLAELRERRADAEQEEIDLSYLRRLVHGRLDILRAERARRSGTASGNVIDDLSEILADDRGDGPRGLGRHSTLAPSRADEHRRRVEAMVADVTLSDVGSMSDEQLDRVLDLFTTEERRVSDLRGAVQRVMDACGAEITRRYRDGEADVGELLAEELD